MRQGPLLRLYLGNVLIVADVASHEEGSRCHNKVKHMLRQYRHQWELPVQGPNIQHETLYYQGQFGPVRGKEHHTLLCEYTGYDLQGNRDIKHFSNVMWTKTFSNIFCLIKKFRLKIYIYFLNLKLTGLDFQTICVHSNCQQRKPLNFCCFHIKSSAFIFDLQQLSGLEAEEWKM